MTVTSTQLISRLRTWALIAGLTALMIAFGALIGGSFLWLFALLAVTANLAGYFYSDRIALRVSRARALPESESPLVHAFVRDLAARAAIPTSRLYVMPRSSCSAS